MLDLVLVGLTLAAGFLLNAEGRQPATELRRLAHEISHARLLASACVLTLCLLVFLYVFLVVVFNYNDPFTGLRLPIRYNASLLMFSVAGLCVFVFYLLRVRKLWQLKNGQPSQPTNED